VANPAANPPGLRVSTCESGYPLHFVLGGFFKFQESACNVGVEPSSWGAIKSMYQ
jgi:hypothetical protein